MRETREEVAEGVFRALTWFDGNRVSLERFVSVVDGHEISVGPLRYYDLDGNVVQEALFTPGVDCPSPEQYEAARAQYSWLPAALDPPPERWREYKRTQKTDPRYLEVQRTEVDDHSRALLAAPGVLSLRAPELQQRRAIVGERSEAASKVLLEKLRKSACKDVWAVDTRLLQDGGEVFDFNGFVLELPDGADERRAVRKLIGPWVRADGFELEPEMGQQYQYISLK